jgi:hypothetical protein
MRLSPAGMAAASAILWGGGIAFVGAMNLAHPDYGDDFLDSMRSIYPGFRKTKGPNSVLVGAAYGALDAAVAGFLFAHLYNAVASK